MKSSASRTALIVGAGIGGLAAGVALRQAGWRIRIYERAASARELGFGLLLAPNALAALRELGVSAPIEAAGSIATNVEIRQTNGRVIRRFNAQFGGRSIVALRPVLHGALLGSVGDDALVLGSEAVSFTVRSDEVTLTLRDGATGSGNLLIGADGIHSVIRRQLHPAEPPPVPSGYTAVRGVAYGAVKHLGDLAAVGYFGPGIEAATARAGGDAIYWYLSLLSKDVPDSARTPADVLKPLLRWFEPRLRAVLDATEPDSMRLDALVRRAPLDSWGTGCVTLLGDAAHPVLPHTGQGAAQALEDAVALRLALLADRDSDRALRRYERVRRARTRKFVFLGPRIARVTTTRNPLVSAVRTVALTYLPEGMFHRATRGLTEDPHRDLRVSPGPATARPPRR